MGYVTLVVLTVVGHVGTVYKDSGGVPIPGIPAFNKNSSSGYASGGSDSRNLRIPVFEFFVNDEPSSIQTIIAENYGLWLTVYAIATWILYVEPQRKLFKPFKLSPHFPDLDLMKVEFMRSARSVFIACLYEHGINWLHNTKRIPQDFVLDTVRIQSLNANVVRLHHGWLLCNVI